jgi:hypothetical protein
MQEYRKFLEGKGNQPSGASGVTTCNSWEDLADLIREAERDYQKQGFRPVRRLSRTIGDHRAALQAWAGLLPTNSNFRVIYGGLSLFLNVSHTARMTYLQMLIQLGRRSPKCSKRKNVRIFENVS